MRAHNKNLRYILFLIYHSCLICSKKVKTDKDLIKHVIKCAITQEVKYKRELRSEIYLKENKIF